MPVTLEGHKKMEVKQRLSMAGECLYLVIVCALTEHGEQDLLPSPETVPSSEAEEGQAAEPMCL